MRVVMFSINYAPDHFGVCPYPPAIADHYAANGHEVTVVTGVPHYPEWTRKAVPPRQQGDRNPAIQRRNHFIPRRPGALGRALYEVSWFISGLRSMAVGRFDAAIGIVPSLSGGMLSNIASNRWKIPFGVVFQDLIGPSALQSGYRGGGQVSGFAKTLELLVARHASRVGVISDAFRPYLVQGGVTSDRIDRVRNWSHPSKATVARDELRHRLAWAPKDFICLHAGNMGQKQALDNVLDAADLLRNDRIRFALAGDGNDRERLERQASARGLTNVQFIGVFGPGEYEALLNASDLLLVNQRASVEEMSLPSKLTSYFVSGRPTVAAASAESATGREVSASGAGLVVQPENPYALADALQGLLRDPELGRAYGERGRDYARTYLTASAALKEYDDFLDRVVGRPTMEGRNHRVVRAGGQKIR